LAAVACLPEAMGHKAEKGMVKRSALSSAALLAKNPPHLLPAGYPPLAARLNVN